MSNRVMICREQYLQQRANAAKLSRRKIIIPGLLFVIPLFTATKLFNKGSPPSTLNEHALFWSLCCIGVTGMIWAYYRMYADVKLAAIHCPACGKNNGGHTASRWLIASGKCIKCGEKMLYDAIVQSGEGASISRADYELKLKQVEHTLLKLSLYVCVPLLVALIWLAHQYTSPTGPEPYHVGLLLVAFGIAAIVLLPMYEWHLGCSKIKCPKCSSNPLRNGSAKIVLATGCCAKCGNPMFTIQRPEGGVA